jgi:hypothetical protein
MSCVHPGHFTQSPSGTRLGFSAVDEAMGLRVFLNHAIGAVLHQLKIQKSKFKIAMPREIRLFSFAF